MVGSTRSCVEQRFQRRLPMAVLIGKKAGSQLGKDLALLMEDRQKVPEIEYLNDSRIFLVVLNSRAGVIIFERLRGPR